MFTCSVTFIRAVLTETLRFTKCHAANRKKNTDLFSYFNYSTDSTFSLGSNFPFYLVKHKRFYEIFSPPCIYSFRSITGILQLGGGEMLLLLRQGIPSLRCHWFRPVDTQYNPSPAVFGMVVVSVLLCRSSDSSSELSFSFPASTDYVPILALWSTKVLPFRFSVLAYFLSDINLFRQLFVAKMSIKRPVPFTGYVQQGE